MAPPQRCRCRTLAEAYKESLPLRNRPAISRRPVAKREQAFKCAKIVEREGELTVELGTKHLVYLIW